MSIFKKLPSVRWKLVLYDAIIFVIASYIFLWRYHGSGFMKTEDMIVHSSVAFGCLILVRIFGLVYSQIWRYGGVQTYMRLIITDTISSVIYGILNTTLPIQTMAMSRVISIMALNMLGCLVIRMTYRYAFKCSPKGTTLSKFLNVLLVLFAGKDILEQRASMRAKKKLAIIGAGRVGVSLTEELLNNTEASMQPICFIDISDEKIGRQIHGIPVLDEAIVTSEVLGDYDIDEIVLAIPSLDKEQKRALFERFKSMGYSMKIYDYPVMNTPGAKRQLRSFEVEEVLFRPPVTLKHECVTAYYRDKVILVTGGGGSIGSEMSRQLADMTPKQLILLDVYENGVYDLQQELKMKYGNELDVKVEIMSITEKSSLREVFRTYKPDIVINAAAHKHVPLMEHNCAEAVYNNVFGMLNVVELCEEFGVGRFMTLSTDKAVNPTNVMGATKRMCEYIMQAYSTKGTLKCSATRFGNVLGSAGSVIPLFRRQIAAGGPVTLTDKRIIRYFMTIPEASSLVLASGAMAKNGELFVLDMGEPVKIKDLAESMISLSGLVPYKDIDIIETGLRPGEKLYEELLMKSDKLTKTQCDLIFVEQEEPVTMEELKEKLDLLWNACLTRDNEHVKEVLHQVVPTFYKPEEINEA